MNAEESMETLRGGLWHTTSESRYEGYSVKQCHLWWRRQFRRTSDGGPVAAHRDGRMCASWAG